MCDRPYLLVLRIIHADCHVQDLKVCRKEQGGQGAVAFQAEVLQGEDAVDIGHENVASYVKGCICIFTPRRSVKKFLHCTLLGGNLNTNVYLIRDVRFHTHSFRKYVTYCLPYIFNISLLRLSKQKPLFCCHMPHFANNTLLKRSACTLLKVLYSQCHTATQHY